MLPYLAVTRAGGYRIVRARIFRGAREPGSSPARSARLVYLGGSIRGLDLVVRPGDADTLMVGYSQLRQWPDLKSASVVRRR
jgi:hypothetical protein